MLISSQCDEARPVCGACSFRSESCSFLRKRTPTENHSRARSEEAGSVNESPSPGVISRNSPAFWHGKDKQQTAPVGLAQPLGIAESLPASAHRGDLEMDDLKLLQFFHLYTAKQMSPHPRRSMIWQRIIPGLGTERRYLMHLLLALGGIHMVTQQAEAEQNDDYEDLGTVDLAIIMEHHQRGLNGFRDEVSCISPSNAELVLTGSMLLVAFAFASLKVPELNPSAVPSPTNGILRLDWLHLNRGVSSVVHDQWPALKASRLRQMVLHLHGDEYWRDLPFDVSSPRLARCSSRLMKFAHGSSQAVADVEASLDALSPPPSLAAVEAHSETIGVLDMVYSRIISVLRCATAERACPVDAEIQMDFEEAAILSWPVLIPSGLFASLETSQRSRAYGHSLIILAHFYLVNTLVDSWFLNGSFEGEIFKISALVRALDDSRLSPLMRWPIEVIES